jgi:hypothetical protein
MIRFVVLCFLLFTGFLIGQSNQQTEKDSALIQKDSIENKPFQLHFGFDGYFASNTADNSASSLPFFVSFSQNRKLQPNLVYADIKWERKQIRWHLTPAMGSFMKRNSATEKGFFKHILEASLGFRLFKSKNTWLDAGVLGSPYTNENPYSQEHLVLTRSLAAEYVPYYLAGFRLSHVPNPRLKVALFLINGWQQIYDMNHSKSLGTQLEFKPDSNNVFNWNTYVGQEGLKDASNFGMRYFSDLFWTHGFSNRFSVAMCTYAGIQQTKVNRRFWWQANTVLRYTSKRFGAANIRLEYYYDPTNAIVAPQIPEVGFNCTAFSVGYSYPLMTQMLLRIEFRYLQNRNAMLYQRSDGLFQKQLSILTMAFTFWI